MTRILFAVATAAGVAACGGPADRPSQEPQITTSAEVELIPRTVLFGNPSRADGQISPDGRWLAYIAPHDGVLNVHVAPAENPDDVRTITNDRERGVRGFWFAHDGRHLLYPQDVGGDENFRINVVALDGDGEARALTPEGARASIIGLSPRHPDSVVVTVNDRDPRFFDLVRIDIASGVSERMLENDRFASFTLDYDLRPRLATAQTPDGGFELFQHDEVEGWRSWLRIAQEDALTSAALSYTHDGGTLYLIDSRDRDTGALFALDTASGERTLVHEDHRADVGGIMTDPRTGRVQAVSVNYLRNEWTVLDPALAGDLEHLHQNLDEGEVHVVSRTLADDRWIVVVTSASAGTRYYRYVREQRELVHWFDTRPELAGYDLAAMHPIEIPARDGLTLVSYLSLPPAADPQRRGRPEQPLPMVLLVHGGPWARDAYGFNGTHQWLTNRGYAVLSVNFRGSTGFGKSFVNAGDLEWGRKMHDDLIDAVRWVVDHGIAGSDQVAIMGGSYGGYATLAGLTFTPETFACGVDIVGPSNLITLLESIPPYWGPIRTMFTSRMGDPDTEEGRALLIERSPLTHVDQIRRPLLIGQGANDPRVKQAESDQIVEAMQARSIPVTYVLYPDEGHGFARPPNRLSFNAVTESFLGECLGGRVEPIGDAFEGATLQVPHGAEFVPGLAQALAQ